jgi:multidrug efflux pump subunit AcrB
LPAPIDVQIEGNDVAASKAQADKILSSCARSRADRPAHSAAVRLSRRSTGERGPHQGAQGGYTEQDVATSVLNTLSGSFQVTPMFFLNWNNGVNYNLVAQTPQYRMDTLQDLQNIPINRAVRRRARDAGYTDAGDISEARGRRYWVERGDEMAVVSHYNMRRVIDIYGSVQDRDLGRGH